MAPPWVTAGLPWGPWWQVWALDAKLAEAGADRAVNDNGGVPSNVDSLHGLGIPGIA